MAESDRPFICGTPMIDRFCRRQFAASLLSADWPAPANVRGFATLRGPAGKSAAPFGPLNLGARSGDDVSVVFANRSDLAYYTGVPSPPHWLHQVHGTRVIQLDAVASQAPYREWERALVRRSIEAEPEADAAVTDTPGVVLAIQTADCLPVLLCADDGSEIAAAHAGWRGLAAGVLENTVAAMRASRASIIAWLGPAISAQSYEVGNEVRDAFLAQDPGAAPAFASTRPGHWQCDLYVLARQRLRAAGITQLHGGGFDTFTDPRFHSYRRDGARSGRMASLVYMLPAAG